MSEQRLPCIPRSRTWQCRLTSCSPWNTWVEQLCCKLQPMEDSRLEEGVMSQRKLQPRWSPHWSRFAPRNCGLQRTHTGAVCSWRTVLCAKNLFWSTLWTASVHRKDPLWRRLGRAVSCEKDSMLQVENSVGRKEKQEWNVIMDWSQPPLLTPLNLLEQG